MFSGSSCFYLFINGLVQLFRVVFPDTDAIHKFRIRCTSWLVLYWHVYSTHKGDVNMLTCTVHVDGSVVDLTGSHMLGH